MDNVNVEEVDLQALLGQLLPGFACASAEIQHMDSCTWTDGDPEPAHGAVARADESTKRKTSEAGMVGVWSPAKSLRFN
jgi:hypothetical protein